jgi:hypothetical protein
VYARELVVMRKALPFNLILVHGNPQRQDVDKNLYFLASCPYCGTRNYSNNTAGFNDQATSNIEGYRNHDKCVKPS